MVFSEDPVLKSESTIFFSLMASMLIRCAKLEVDTFFLIGTISPGAAAALVGRIGWPPFAVPGCPRDGSGGHNWNWNPHFYFASSLFHSHPTTAFPVKALDFSSAYLVLLLFLLLFSYPLCLNYNEQVCL